MPSEIALPVLGILLVALTAGGMELRAAMHPPVCPRCIHCKHEALAKKERGGRDWWASVTSMWSLHDKDDDGRPRR